MRRNLGRSRRGRDGRNLGRSHRCGRRVRRRNRGWHDRFRDGRVTRGDSRRTRVGRYRIAATARSACTRSSRRCSGPGAGSSRSDAGRNRSRLAVAVKRPAVGLPHCLIRDLLQSDRVIDLNAAGWPHGVARVPASGELVLHEAAIPNHLRAGRRVGWAPKSASVARGSSEALVDDVVGEAVFTVDREGVRRAALVDVSAPVEPHRLPRTGLTRLLVEGWVVAVVDIGSCFSGKQEREGDQKRCDESVHVRPWALARASAPGQDPARARGARCRPRTSGFRPAP